MTLRRRTQAEIDTYIDGFEAGARAVIGRLEVMFPDLDDPEHGGPIAEATDFVLGTLAIMREAAKP